MCVCDSRNRITSHGMKFYEKNKFLPGLFSVGEAEEEWKGVNLRMQYREIKFSKFSLITNHKVTMPGG